MFIMIIRFLLCGLLSFQGSMIGLSEPRSSLGFALCTHGDESETLGLATLPVFDDFCGADFPRLREQYI